MTRTADADEEAPTDWRCLNCGTRNQGETCIRCGDVPPTRTMPMLPEEVSDSLRTWGITCARTDNAPLLYEIPRVFHGIQPPVSSSKHLWDVGEPLTEEHSGKAREAWGIALPHLEVLPLRHPRANRQSAEDQLHGTKPQARRVVPDSLLLRRLNDEAAIDGTFRRRMNGAIVSDDGRYRYRLWREYDGGSGSVTFVMLNPSSADAAHDDPTIRRCIGFSRMWNVQRLDVVNLFAWRATDPRELSRVSEPVGPENDEHILDACRTAELVICAWGSRSFARRRAQDVARMLRGSGIPLRCLRRSRNGGPWHPLYIPYRTKPISFGVA